MASKRLGHCIPHLKFNFHLVLKVLHSEVHYKSLEPFLNGRNGLRKRD